MIAIFENSVSNFAEFRYLCWDLNVTYLAFTTECNACSFYSNKNPSLIFSYHDTTCWLQVRTWNLQKL